MCLDVVLFCICSKIISDVEMDYGYVVFHVIFPDFA